jgi:hypothetical protein
MCVCSLSYPESNAHVPYFIVICGLSACTRIILNVCQMTRYSIKVIEDKMCVLIFSTILSETFLILRRIKRDFIINVCWSSFEVLFILVRF